MNKEKLIELLNKLNNLLILNDSKIVMNIYGGSCLALAYNLRDTTMDIDAIYGNKQLVNKLVKQISRDEGIEYNWLNDSVKGFVSTSFKYSESEFKFSNIEIRFPSMDGMLAMKLISARLSDSKDKDDILKLIKKLNITTEEECFEILEMYYPIKLIPMKTTYVIKEIIEEINKNNLEWN